MWWLWWKDTVNDYKYISINNFYRRWQIEEWHRSGSLIFWLWWSQTGDISYILNIGKENYLQLKFTAIGENQSEQKFDYKIILDKTSSNYWWYRYWFMCPCTWRRCTKLYLQSNWYFCDRKALKLYYSAQLEKRPLRWYYFWWLPYLNELYDSIKYKYRNGKATKKRAKYIKLANKLQNSLHIIANGMRSNRFYKKYWIV